ncbi:hypothetical protein ACHAWF_011400 [Thalassiosira exigua]
MAHQPMQPPMPTQQPQPPPAPAGMPPSQQQALLTSPPISPLWNAGYNASSPGQTPPDQDGPDAPRGPGPAMPAVFDAGPPDAAAGAIVPRPTISPSGAPAVANPFDMFAPPAPAQAPAQAPADPFASGGDPYGAGAAPAQPQSQPPSQQQQEQGGDDAAFWDSMGFDAPAAPADDSPGNVTPTGSASDASLSSAGSGSYDDGSQGSPDRERSAPVTLDERGLPSGGEYYKARVTTPMLGAIFASGAELRSTLYKAASDAFVDAIGDRPVISFTIDGSAADTAGIGLGHVLLKVNDQDVTQTEEAVRMVGHAARPMIMEFYAPSRGVQVVKTEGQCMVKYDNSSTLAPASQCEWKPKYVVVGDMLGKPHILYMYRSKAEYDIAVKESQAQKRKLSVKVKQFDIRGARIFHERGSVQYPNKPRWHYFTIVRGTGNPIKISCRTREELMPVMDGVACFLDAEDRAKRERAERERERMRQAGMYRETYY